MFEDIAFVAIWLALPFFWHYLLKVAGLSLRRLTIPAFVVLAFYVYQFIGLPLLYFQLDEARAGSVTNQRIIVQVFIYTSITVTLMLFGYIAGRRVFGPLKWAGVAEIRSSGKTQMIGVLLLFSVCVAVLLLYLSKVGFDKIALLTVLGLGDEISAGVARSAMGNAFEGTYHRYYLFMNKLLLFCAYAFFAQYLLKPDFRNRLLFILVFIIATFAMTMATEKGPMANYIISLLIVYILVKRGGVVPIRAGIYLGIILLIVFTFIYMAFMNIGDPIQAFFLVVSRVFTGQIQPAYHYLEFFPSNHDFLLGVSFPNPGGFLPFQPYELTKEIMAWHNPSQANIGVVGSMPTVYWGEMYANFGFVGVLLPPFFVGMVLYWLNSLILRLRPDPLVVALIAWFMMHLKNLCGTSLSGYFFDTYALATLFFFFVIVFITGRGAVKLRKKFLSKQKHSYLPDILHPTRVTFSK